MPRSVRSTPGLFFERQACSHLRAAAHAPLGHTGLTFDSSLPPRHRGHSANAQTLLAVGWREHVQSVVASLPEVSSTEKNHD